jgi:hypothetical protein
MTAHSESTQASQACPAALRPCTRNRSGAPAHTLSGAENPSSQARSNSVERAYSQEDGTRHKCRWLYSRDAICTWNRGHRGHRPSGPLPTTPGPSPKDHGPARSSRSDPGRRGHIGWVVAGSLATGLLAALLPLDHDSPTNAGLVNVPAGSRLRSCRVSRPGFQHYSHDAVNDASEGAGSEHRTSHPKTWLEP